MQHSRLLLVWQNSGTEEIHLAVSNQSASVLLGLKTGQNAPISAQEMDAFWPVFGPSKTDAD